MSGVGITYLWINKEFPPFVRLEGKRGDYEVYVPERTCHDVNTDLANAFECSMCGFMAIVHNCTNRLDELPSYCPNCGRWVRS